MTAPQPIRMSKGHLKKNKPGASRLAIWAVRTYGAWHTAARRVGVPRKTLQFAVQRRGVELYRGTEIVFLLRGNA